MRKRLSVFPFLAAVVIGGCAPTPVGPTVMVLPGPGKSLEQFRTDDADCRPWASQQVGTSHDGYGTAQWRYDIAYQQCMYAKGNQISGGRVRDTTPLAPPPSSPPPK